MASPPGVTRCPRCGLVNSPAASSCAGCGFGGIPPAAGAQAVPFARGGAIARQAIAPPLPAPAIRPTIHPASLVGRIRRWKVLRGTVTHVDQLYMTKAETNWLGCLGKLLLALLILPVFLPLFITLYIMRGLGLFGSDHPAHHGFLGKVASDVVAFFLTQKLVGIPAQVPVRDVRILTPGGSQHLARLRGDLRSGGIAVGDDVTVEGPDRAGMLLVRHGYNHRAGCEIEVTKP